MTGLSINQHDIASRQRFLSLAALLDHDTPPWHDGQMPPLGHWLCFHPQALQSHLADDGHPRREADGLPVPQRLSRRMWAGSRVEFIRDVAIDAALVRTTSIVEVIPKTGRSGEMVFVTLQHNVFLNDGTLAIREYQDIVYREPAERLAQPATPLVMTEHPYGARTVTPDETLLFRFSALTFNSHRIHYDAPYAISVEGYPALVVHGPLVATLLMDHFLQISPGRRVAEFSFRAVAPAFCGQTLSLRSLETDDEICLEAIGPSGPVMSAKVTCA